MKWLWISVCVFAGASSGFAQGSLTPPGAPTPTMKSLDQIEARTPIPGGGAFTISTPGSYYLTGNITVASGDGITIAADAVTLDLNGFSVSSTHASGSGYGVRLNNARKNVAIQNGFVQGGTTSDGNGNYTGAGFLNGIYFTGAAEPLNVRVKDVSVSGCKSHGIYLGTNNGSVVISCTTNITGTFGILAATVMNSSAFDAGAAAITAVDVQNCEGVATTTSGVGIYAFNVTNSKGLNTKSGANDGYGIHATGTATGCYAKNNGDGFGLVSDAVADHCSSESANGFALAATTVSACKGVSFGNGWGIAATSATGSSGESSSSRGLGAVVTLNCKGKSTSGDGLIAEVATNCIGESIGGDGMFAYRADNCEGRTSAGTGLDAYSAFNSFGSTSTGTGLSVRDMGAMCKGERLSPSASNHVLGAGLAGPFTLP